MFELSSMVPLKEKSKFTPLEARLALPAFSRRKTSRRRQSLRPRFMLSRKILSMTSSSAILDTKIILVRKPVFFCVKDAESSRDKPRQKGKIWVGANFAFLTKNRTTTSIGGRGCGHARHITSVKKTDKFCFLKEAFCSIILCRYYII